MVYKKKKNNPPEKPIVKIHGESQGVHIAKTISKKNKVEGVTFTDFKTPVTRTVWY